MNVRKMFFDMDQKLLLACEKKFQEEEEKQAASEERRRLIWEHLERNASFHPVTRDISFAVLPKSAPLVALTMT
jgi:serine/threonine-protein phosphatase 2A regulatory subunit B'